MREPGRTLPLAGLLAAVTVGACQVIGGFAGNEIVQPGGGGQGGANVGGGGQGGTGGGGEECALLQAPTKPQDAPVGDDVSFILAARRIMLGEDLDVDVGLDLDDACTCGAEACDCASVATCARPGVLDEDEWDRCDGDGGVDANSTQLFSIVQAFDGFLSSDALNLGILAGAGSMLFDVRSYNGEANDEDVFVGMYATGRFQDAVCNAGAPVWDGNDAWPIDRDSVTGDLMACNQVPQPAFFDPLAYVADHQLVARLDELTLVIQFLGTPVRLRLLEATVVIPLEREGTDGPWQANGATVTGHWHIEDVFRSVAELNALSPGDLCSPSVLGSTQKSVCAHADSLMDGRPSDPCDAVSFGLAFDAFEAQVGNTIEIPPSSACLELVALDCETPAP